MIFDRGLRVCSDCVADELPLTINTQCGTWRAIGGAAELLLDYVAKRQIR